MVDVQQSNILRFSFVLQVLGKYYGLRQQAEKDGDEPYLCVSDFIAPKTSNIIDYIGAFACSAGHGLEEVVAGFKAAHDDYSYIMAEALADRLAEAFAEKLHELTRRQLWGYAPDEHLSVDDMLKVKYQVRTSNIPLLLCNDSAWGCNW